MQLSFQLFQVTELIYSLTSYLWIGFGNTQGLHPEDLIAVTIIEKYIDFKVIFFDKVHCIQQELSFKLS